MVSVSDWWESVSAKNCVCASPCSQIPKIKQAARFNKSMLHRPPSHLLKRQCCWSQRKVQGEETKAVSAWPQEFTKFRFSSSSLGDDLNVTRVQYPSSCFMKTLCLESTLHIMLPRPIGPCIKERWRAGILSILQLTRSTQPCLAVVGSWRRDLVGKLKFLTNGQGSWERVTSVTAPVIWPFRSFLLDWRRSFPQHLRRRLLGSFAGMYCSKGFEIWILQHPTCLSPHCHSALIYIDPKHCKSLRMFQVVVEKVLALTPPTTKLASLDVHNLTSKNRHTDYSLPIMKCLLFASWKACTTHSLAGCTHQTAKRHWVVVRAHLDFASSE